MPMLSTPALTPARAIDDFAHRLCYDTVMIIYAMKTRSPFTSFALKICKIGLLIIAITWVGQAAVLADDYTDSLKRAKAEDKAVILYFFSKSCGYCTMMEKQVLADKEIAASMKNDVVSLRIDVDAKPDLAAKYNIRGYPTTGILEPSGKIVIRVPGYLEKKEFKLVLAYAKGKAYKTASLREYFKKAGVQVD